jgi:hypothetical protein
MGDDRHWHGGSLFAEHMPFPSNNLGAGASAAAAAADPWAFLKTERRERKNVVRLELQKPYSIDELEAAAYFPIPYTFHCPGNQCVRTFQLPAGPIADDTPWKQEWERAERHWKTQCTYAQMRRERRNKQQRAIRQAKRVQVR